MKKKIRKESWVCCLIVCITTLLCLLPVWIAVAASFSMEKDIINEGYRLWPKNPTLSTYRFMLEEQGKQVFRAYVVSLMVTICGTIYSMIVMTTYAYAASQSTEVFPLARVLSFVAWLTTVLSGGTLPWYILCTRYYGLQNNLWALFIPYGMSVFNMFLIRNAFKTVPVDLYEAAKIDGASNLKVFVQIAIPLSKVGMITVGLFTALNLWNDYHLCLYLTSSQKLQTLQKMLRGMTSNLAMLLSNSEVASEALMREQIPAQTAQMAMMVLTVIPVMCFYPAVQKYFVKGITIGAVKG